MGIKESQYADHLNEGGPRYFLLLDQKQLVLANVLGTEPIRWLAEVLGELGYAVQIFEALSCIRRTRTPLILRCQRVSRGPLVL